MQKHMTAGLLGLVIGCWGAPAWSQDAPSLQIVWPPEGASLPLGGGKAQTVGVVVQSNFKLMPAGQCGVLLEPIQGEGGVRVPSAGYLQGVREICDRHNILMLLDEVQVGVGRTGTLFAYEQAGIRPDIVTLAKALGNGFPVGAMLTTDTIASAFQPGSHASTFGGNPLAMAACIAVFETLEADGVLANCRKVGSHLIERLRRLQDRHDRIREVRGRGLLIGVELAGDAAEAVASCRERGLLVITSGAGNVLRFVPPLILSKADADRAVDILDEVLKQP